MGSGASRSRAQRSESKVSLDASISSDDEEVKDTLEEVVEVSEVVPCFSSGPALPGLPRPLIKASRVPAVELQRVTLLAQELQLTPDQLKGMKSWFASCDFAKRGLVRFDDVHGSLPVARTRFTERMLTCVLGHDHDLPNRWLTFTEFVAVVYNVCTLDSLALTQFLVGMFDVQARGKVNKTDVLAIVRMMFDVPHAYLAGVTVLTLVDALFGAKVKGGMAHQGAKQKPSTGPSGGLSQQSGAKAKPRKFCTADDLLAIAAPDDHPLLAPMFEFQVAVRAKLDSHSPAPHPSWAKSEQGRLQRIRFSAALMSKVLKRYSGDARYRALLSRPALPDKGSRAYAHGSNADVSRKGMLFSLAKRPTPGGVPVPTLFVIGWEALKPEQLFDMFTLRINNHTRDFRVTRDDRGLYVHGFRSLTGTGGPGGRLQPGDVIAKIGGKLVGNTTPSEANNELAKDTSTSVTFYRRPSAAKLFRRRPAARRLDPTRQAGIALAPAVLTSPEPVVVSPTTTVYSSAQPLAIEDSESNLGLSPPEPQILDFDTPADEGKQEEEEEEEDVPEGKEEAGSGRRASRRDEDDAPAPAADDAPQPGDGDGQEEGTEEHKDECADEAGAATAAGEAVEETKADAPPPPRPTVNTSSRPPRPSKRRSAATLGPSALSPAPKPAVSSLVFTVTFPGDALGMRLGATKRGIRVDAKTDAFDHEAGADVAVGDYLVKVNDSDIGGMSLESAVAVIKAEPPPRNLQFVRIQPTRRQPQLDRHDVEFQNPVLGLKLVETQRGVRIKGFNDTFDEELRLEVMAGDYIVAVNGTAPQDASMGALLELLQANPPPRVLRLGRRRGATRLSRQLPAATVFTVEFPTAKVGLQLGETRRGIVVQGFRDTFDKVAGKDVTVGDLLTAVNDTPLAGMDLDAAVDVIRDTPPPRTFKFVRLVALRRPPADPAVPQAGAKKKARRASMADWLNSDTLSEHDSDDDDDSVESDDELVLALPDMASDHGVGASPDSRANDFTPRENMVDISEMLFADRFFEIQLKKYEKHRVDVFLANWREDEEREPEEFELIAAWATNDIGRIVRHLMKARTTRHSLERQRVKEAAEEVKRANLESKLREKATRKLYRGTEFNTRTLYNDGSGLSDMVPSDSEPEVSDHSRASSPDVSDDEEGNSGEDDEDDGDEDEDEDEEEDEEAEDGDGDDYGEEGDADGTPRTGRSVGAGSKATRTSLSDPESDVESRVFYSATGSRRTGSRRTSVASDDSVDDPFPDHHPSLGSAVAGARSFVPAARDWKLPYWADNSYLTGPGKKYFRYCLKSALGSLECERFYQERRPPEYTAKRRQELLEMQRVLARVERDMLKAWNVKREADLTEAGANAEGNMRHRFVVNEAVNKQKEEEAQQLMWTQKNWHLVAGDGAPPMDDKEITLEKAKEMVKKDEISAAVYEARKEVKKLYKKRHKQKDRIRTYAEDLAAKCERRLRRWAAKIMADRRECRDLRDGVVLPPLPKVKNPYKLLTPTQRPDRPSLTQGIALPKIEDGAGAEL